MLLVLRSIGPKYTISKSFPRFVSLSLLFDLPATSRTAARDPKMDPYSESSCFSLVIPKLIYMLPFAVSELIEDDTDLWSEF